MGRFGISGVSWDGPMDIYTFPWDLNRIIQKADSSSFKAAACFGTGMRLFKFDLIWECLFQ
jgi:hypothetical protein